MVLSGTERAIAHVRKEASGDRVVQLLSDHLKKVADLAGRTAMRQGLSVGANQRQSRTW